LAFWAGHYIIKVLIRETDSNGRRYSAAEKSLSGTDTGFNQSNLNDHLYIREKLLKNIYQRECRLTLVAFLVTTLLTHIYPLYFLFPELTQTTLFGFPAHYFLSLVIGWLVLMPLYWIYIQMSERIDKEIQEIEPADYGDEIQGAAK
jgi:putative solute:sodium symporter small subunit